MPPEGLALHQRRAFPTSRPPDSFLHHSVHQEKIVAADVHAGEPVGLGPRGDPGDGERLVERRRVRIAIVLAQEDHAELVHDSKVHCFVRISHIRSPFTEKCHHDLVLALELEAVGNPAAAGGHPAIVRFSRDEKVRGEGIRIHCLTRA
jgi:hypothetical protein